MERLAVLGIREILLSVRAGESDWAIARALSLSRETVKKYRLSGEQEGLLQGNWPRRKGRTHVDNLPCSPPHWPGHLLGRVVSRPSVTYVGL